MKVFNIIYETSEGTGIATVTANSPGEAQTILKSQGRLNGIPREYKITSIVEVNPCKSYISQEVHTPQVIINEE